MYFPYLHGKQAEVLAVRELSASMGGPQVIWPIIEPVKTGTGGLVNTFKALRLAGSGVFLVVNPNKDEFLTHSAEVAAWHATLAADIADPLVVRPTFLQGPHTTLSELNAFVRNFVGRKVGLVLTSDDIAAADVAAALAGVQCTTFLHRNVARPRYVASLGASATVDIESNFEVRDRNADYSGTSPQGDNHLTWQQAGRAGFSDYTVLPGTYKKGGGLTWALAIHMTYVEQAGLMVQHFVSTTDTPGKFLQVKFDEALTDLLAQMAATPLRFTPSPGLAKYFQQQVTGNYTSPEGNKRQQIGHHIFTVARLMGVV